MSRGVALAAALAAAPCFAPPATAATTVMVMSLAPGRAELVVNGTAVRSLRDGQTSPEGVRLVSASAGEALIEIDGRRYVFTLGGTNARSTALKADRQGLFWTVAYLNGQPLTALIDTGATLVTLPAEEAGRLGVAYGPGQRITLRTAGGPREGYRVTLASVRVGDITLHNVDGAVMAGGGAGLPAAVIGMSFLNGVEMRRVGDTLTLIHRH
ncbi:MAG: TIGR02281 family clan AA aspartic protease [Burkholderiales bacterium]|nr:TIGR02281 family clan AA aspartic protease [Burkholderiales bacterium]